MSETSNHDSAMNAVAIRREDRSQNIASARPLLVADVLAVESQQRELLGRYVAEQMVDGTDYGVIPGTKKRTLFKPGAEKLCSLFRCTPRFEIVEKIENWGESPFFHYHFRVYVESNESGAVVAEGFGSANSKEGKWRWRDGGRKCPLCGSASIIKGKAEYGGGYLCFAKKGGCGAKYPDGDQQIEGQTVGRTENPDICNEVNTILKIAKKRALTDAAISLARCSDLFTQDMDDAVGPNQDHDHPHEDTRPRQHTATAQQQTTPKPDTESLYGHLCDTIDNIAANGSRDGHYVAEWIVKTMKAKWPKTPDRLAELPEAGLKQAIKIAEAKLAELTDATPDPDEREPATPPMPSEKDVMSTQTVLADGTVIPF